MALVLADRVQETTNTTGTGTLTLAGATSGCQSFAAIGNGNTTYYTIVSGTDWEVGIGTYTSAGTTLSRDTVLASSAGGTTKIPVAAGATVFGDYPAGRAVFLDASGALSGYSISGGSINNTPIGGSTPTTIAGTNISSATAPTNTVAALALTGTPNASSGGKVGVLAVGSNFTASDKNIMASFVQSINDYTQIIVQNPNSGSAASADFIVNNDNTTGSGVYGDFGINSSAFSGTGSFSLPSATYLYSNGGDLVIGTQTANTLRFVTSNASTDAASISSAGVLTLGTPLALGSGGTGKATAPAAMANLMGYASTATAGTTTALSNTSAFQQLFTGSSNQTVTLPDTATLATGWSFYITNDSTGTLTVNSFGGNLVGTIPAGLTAMPTCISTSVNTAAAWDWAYNEFSTITGTGNLVLSTSPSLTTPVLGAATATSINKVAFTAPATAATLTIADGKTLTANNSLTLSGTDSTTMTFPTTSQSIAGLGVAQTWTAAQTFRAASAIRSEAAATQDAVVIAGRAGGTGSFASTITPTTLTANRTVTIPDETMTVGFRNIPPVGNKNTAYTLAVGDVGKYVQVISGGSIVVPNSTFAEGDIVSVFNNTTAAVTITLNTTTAYLAGVDASKASLSLATRGVATILFISSTICVVSGNVS